MAGGKAKRSVHRCDMNRPMERLDYDCTHAHIDVNSITGEFIKAGGIWSDEHPSQQPPGASKTG